MRCAAHAAEARASRRDSTVATARLARETSSATAAVATGGQSLSPAERAFFEPRFGRDLSHVRLHVDAAAARAATGVGARAYTLRNHIAFGAGQYAPRTTEGRRLLAHELTHTLQQGFGEVLRRVPLDAMHHDDPERDPEELRAARRHDPRGPGQSTLTYAESRELRNCIEVMGDSEVAAAECANIVLGTPIPEWKSVPGISSPVPFRAQVSAAGVATHRIGAANLTILPDAHSADQAMANGAQTRIDFPPFAGGQLVDIEPKRGSPVTAFSFNQDLTSLTIQTTYGPGAAPGGASGYGRGTTQADQASGQTTLGFHEGEHGRDFILFLQDHPYPVFEGRIGQSRAVFIGHVRRYRAAVQQYVRRMTQHSLHATDCVGGTTLDESNSAQGRITQHCRGVRVRR